MRRESLADFEPLLPAEREVVEKLRAGDWDELGIVDVGDGTLPEPDDEGRSLRGEFVRFLCLGGDDATRPSRRGVRVDGARILGALDLASCNDVGDVMLVRCRFDAVPRLSRAQVGFLSLSGSHLPGLSADGLMARHDVFLRNTTFEGDVRLLGARIGDSLDCDGIVLEGESECALICDRLTADGSVFLGGAKIRGGANFRNAQLRSTFDCEKATFERPEEYALNCSGLKTQGSAFVRNSKVHGGVLFHGAQLAGNFECEGTTIDRPKGTALGCEGLNTDGSALLGGMHVVGEVRLSNARIANTLSCSKSTFLSPGKTALRLDGLDVGGAFFLRNEARLDGVLSMVGANLGEINDDKACWPADRDLVLDRCRYGAFTGGPVTARERLEWLALQDESRWGEEFWPQPYEQLAKVFREMGHTSDARRVLIEKERRQRRSRRRRRHPTLRWAYALLDGLLAVTVGYGRRPFQAFAWLLGLWLLGGFLFASAASGSALKPNNAFVLRSPEWTGCADPGGGDAVRRPGARGGSRRRAEHASQLDCFLDQPEAAAYPRFNAWVYSLDTLLPVVDLEMQEHWIPDETAAWRWARHARWYLWVHIGAGWALSLLAVAGFSGLVKLD